MIYLIRVSIILFVTTLHLGIAAASEFGTAQEARSMLERVVGMLQIDKSSALDAFNQDEGGFRDRDLYVFCAGSDGVFTAHPRGVGKWSLLKVKGCVVNCCVQLRHQCAIDL